jgi:UDP-3-O-[3-hydroxymyristoyl] glucosamine N-acyltransferase
MEITVKDISNYIDPDGLLPQFGKNDLVISQAGSLEEAKEHSITWIKPGHDISKLIGRKNLLVVCNYETYEQGKVLEDENAFLIASEPRYLFSKIVNNFFSSTQSGIHASAIIHEDAVIGENCFIGPFCYIGKSSLGNNVRLHGNCFIYDEVRIGNDVTIHAGTVIGSDGFGYTRNEAGAVEKFPHLGGVEIGDDVEIGANTCIDRGSLGNTIIGNGVKIDNLVHIAHNVIIEENSFIIANAMIGGSTVVGRNAWIAPSASILQQLKIGDNALVGVGSVVRENIPSDETWAGVPAKKIK